MNEISIIIANIKSKDKKLRYLALEEIMAISRSNKKKQKAQLLNSLNEKAKSRDWEERYVSMYGISRFMWRSGTFEDFKKTYYHVLKLLEDEDGRVRIAAFYALEHFRSFFIAFVFGGLNHFHKKDIAPLWLHSLIVLWEKTKAMDNGKQQYFLMKCIDTLFRSDMEEYLNDKEHRIYIEIWDKLQELENEYNENRK